MIVWPVALFLLFVVVAQELFQTKTSFKDFVSLILKYGTLKKTPSKKISGLIFVSFAAFWFAVWESTLRYMFQSRVELWLFALCALLFLFLVFVRAKKLKDLSQPWRVSANEYFALTLAFTLMLGAYFSAMVFCPWLYWRTKRAFT